MKAVKVQGLRQVQIQERTPRDVRETFKVTVHGIEPARLLLGSDKDGFMPKAIAPSANEIELVREWMSFCCKPTLKMQRRYDSYAYAHMVAQWFKARGKAVYVSNGAVIRAAQDGGFKVIRARKDGPNAYFDYTVMPSQREACGIITYKTVRA